MQHAHGLAADLDHWLRQRADRRRALRWLLAGGTGAGLSACGGGSAGDDAASTAANSTGTSTSSTTSSGASTATVSSCSVIPEETAGPYPGDGSNSSGSGVANALALTGIVRSDIRASFDGASEVANGVPLTLKLQLVNTNGGCAELDGFAIYLWHCDALGRYSMYTSGVTGEKFLRGVQPTDSSGVATFTTIFPGCYLGRMPHMHFEVYRSTTTATSFSNKLETSQIAFPNDVSTAVYATSGYGTSRSNFAQISFATDTVFADGYATQLAALSGDVVNGYQATLVVGIAV